MQQLILNNLGMKKLLLIILVCIGLFSCSSDESETTTTDGSSETIISPTRVTLTVTNANNETKSNYIVMMFDEPVNFENNLPEILMQETSDLEGKAVFELDEFISENGEGTYFFEAFTEIENGYLLESITHPSFEIEEGKIITSSIIVE